jgi:hypothetical protein
MFPVVCIGLDDSIQKTGAGLVCEHHASESPSGPFTSIMARDEIIRFAATWMGQRYPHRFGGGRHLRPVPSASTCGRAWNARCQANRRRDDDCPRSPLTMQNAMETWLRFHRLTDSLIALPARSKAAEGVSIDAYASSRRWSATELCNRSPFGARTATLTST